MVKVTKIGLLTDQPKNKEKVTREETEWLLIRCHCVNLTNGNLECGRIMIERQQLNEESASGNSIMP